MGEKSQNTNLASEYYVLSMLYRMGADAHLTLGNKKSVDIVVEKDGEILTIDVKGLKDMSCFPIDNWSKKSKVHFLVFVSFQKKISDLRHSQGFNATYLAKDSSGAKLKVRFAPAILSFLPFVWGDYWIIDLADDYSHAVVGDPCRKYLWVLSRKPAMPDDKLDGILKKAEQKSCVLDGLIRTKQPGGN